MKKNKLALFDLDDTLFDGDTEGEWVEYMDKNNLIRDPDFFKKMDEYNIKYRKGILDVGDYSEFLLSPLVGRSLKELEVSIEIFTTDVVERLTDELTEELLLKHENDIKVLTSGSLSFLVNKISQKLGISVSFGTDPEYEGDVFTGKVYGNPNFSDEKVRRIKYWIKNKQFDEIFSYSDSIYDLPLLEFSDFPLTIGPDSKLRKIAKERNWPIEDRRKLHS
ncbi:MAG: HAD family phosphatase [SAR86 cluster bacterium]|nr:HAD family phosphatase [SAR86 cluster bacterium]